LGCFFLLGGRPPAVAESTGQTLVTHPTRAWSSRPAKSDLNSGASGLALRRNLKWERARIYWHLYTFSSKAAADTAKTPTGIVVEENGRVWLSEFGQEISFSMAVSELRL